MGPPPPERPPIDRELFRVRSDAALHRIERRALLILAGSGLLTLLFFGSFGASFLIGGLFGMFNFRSLHRMFQRRILDPSRRRKEQLFYSLKLFFLIGLFFWVIRWKSASPFGILIGFFMITASVFWETTRK